MPSNLKHRVRERMAKTGETWVTALRHVRAEAEAAPLEAATPAASSADRLAALLGRLGATRTFPIRVGQGPALGASANLGAAEARARRAMGNGTFYAATGAIELRVEEADHDLLVASGAADDRHVQILRSFHNDKGVAFSEPCSACDRWLFCGHEEREGNCVCGQAFRVTFDLAAVYHWSSRAGRRCMDCGAERAQGRAINESQMRCDDCASRDARPAPMARTARLLFATVQGEQAIELRSTNSLGRQQGSSIQLLDKIVAKEHCVLERRGEAFVLRDLGSLNGTYVNGERVRGERRLTHGDEIALGATRARYDDGSGPLRFAPLPISAGVYAGPSRRAS
jgi:hypothetical protein